MDSSINEPSINLTPHREPSVWDEPEVGSSSMHMVIAASGAAIALLAWGTGRPRRSWIAGLGAAGAVAALMSSHLGDHAQKAIAGARSRRRARHQEPLDRTLKETFPASDSPAVW